MVLRGDHPRRRGQPALGVPRVAGHGAGRADGRGERLAVGRRVVGGVRTVVPLDHQGGAPAQRRPGVVGDDGHAAQGLERRGQGQGRHADDPPHAGDLQGRGVVEPRHRAAHDRRPRDDRGEHPRQAHVGAEGGLAGDVGRAIDQGQRRAHARPLGCRHAGPRSRGRARAARPRRRPDRRTRARARSADRGPGGRGRRGATRARSSARRRRPPASSARPPRPRASRHPETGARCASRPCSGRRSGRPRPPAPRAPGSRPHPAPRRRTTGSELRMPWPISDRLHTMETRPSAPMCTNTLGIGFGSASSPAAGTRRTPSARPPTAPPSAATNVRRVISIPLTASSRRPRGGSRPGCAGRSRSGRGCRTSTGRCPRRWARGWPPAARPRS